MNIKTMLKLLTVLFVVLFSISNATSQTKEPSHLERMTYEDLLELFNDFEGDSLAQERIARTYLKRARTEGDTVKVARGYDRLARVFGPETNIKYADTLIEYTKEWQHITYPVMGYILKAYELGRLNKIKEKYSYLTLGLEFAKKNDNVAQTTYILADLWNIRNKWGNVRKAHEMQLERHAILLSSDYLTKLEGCTRAERKKNLLDIREAQLLESHKIFVISYLSLKKIDSARIHLDSLNKMLSLYDGPYKENYYWWVKDAENEINYYDAKYELVISNTDTVLQNESFQLHENIYLNTLLFRGLTEYEIGNIDKSIKFLDMVEANRDNFSYLHNDYLKLLFQTKLEIHKKLSNPIEQIYYLDELLKIDSIEASLYKFIEPKLVNELDSANLIEAKEHLIAELNTTHKNDRIRILIIGVLLVVVSLVAIYSYRQKVIFKKRFEAIMASRLKKEEEKQKGGQLDLAPSIVEDILHRLESFEKKKDFLEADITLNALAKTFQTNSSYLSRVLNHHKKKNFSQYLNGLRVGYALEEIKNNPNFRKYTIEAIAYECGYKNSASFSRAFYREVGIYPSYFVNELNKIKDDEA